MQETSHYEAVWLIQTKPSGVEIHINDLEKYPEVRIDVESYHTLIYPINSTVIEVIQKATEEYGKMPLILNSIELYATVIYEAYKATVVYEKAECFYYQYNANTNNHKCIRIAYNVLKDTTLYSIQGHQLLDMIKGIAKLNNIELY